MTLASTVLSQYSRIADDDRIQMTEAITKRFNRIATFCQKFIWSIKADTKSAVRLQNDP